MADCDDRERSGMTPETSFEMVTKNIFLVGEPATTCEKRVRGAWSPGMHQIKYHSGMPVPWCRTHLLLPLTWLLPSEMPPSSLLTLLGASSRQK